MPTFEFTSPEGKKYEVEGPEGSTPEQAFGKLQQQLQVASDVSGSPVTDIARGLTRVPDTLVQGLVDIWNTAGQFDARLNRVKEPTLQIPFDVTQIADVVLEKPKGVTGEAARVLGTLAIGGVPLFLRSAGQKAISKTVSVFKKAGKKAGLREFGIKTGTTPGAIAEQIGATKLSAIPEFGQRFPNMARAGVDTVEDAFKASDDLYKIIPKMKGLKARLSTQGFLGRPSLKQQLDMTRITTVEGMIPAKLEKALDNVKTVEDRFKAARDLRLLMRKRQASIADARARLNILNDLPLAPGQNSAAYSTISAADGIYAEAMGVKRFTEVLEKASKLGKSGQISVVTGQPVIRAIDALKGMDRLGEATLRREFGGNFDRVRAALRRMGSAEITPGKAGTLMRLTGGLIDWRALSFLGLGVVGTREYHVMKAATAGAVAGK